MDGFRFGILDGIVNSRISPSVLPRVGSLTAAATGADSYWVGDHLNSFLPRSIATPEYLGVAAKLVPKIDAVLEPWTMLGHLAARNRVRRLRLGVCVTDAGRRNPAVTAQAAATLHLLTRGRAMLGIGVGEREGNEPYGVEWTKPVARLEEAVATIRTLWDSAGEPVSRDSPYFPLKNAVFDLPPYRGKWPEIWVAAHRRAHMRFTRRRRRFTEPMLSVHQRPFRPEDRSQPGHWEGDVIVGPQHRSAIGTLVERQSRLVKLIHLARPDSFELRDGLLRELAGLPALLLQSITWDQGSEMARHLEITAVTGAKVYFCDAGSPWQRGTNENTNGLLRQYFPKGTDLSRHNRGELARVERELNNRPRAVLHDRTPAEIFTQLLTSKKIPMLHRSLETTPS